MKKIIVIVWIASMLMMQTACSSNVDTVYEIVQHDRIVTVEGDQYAIPYFEVVNANKKTVEKKANESIETALDEIIFIVGKQMLFFSLADLSVQCQNERYFSFKYEKSMDADPNFIKFGSCRICVTIDMNTGERIFLDDLIDNSTMLYEYTLEYESPYSTFYSPIEREEAEEIFCAASMNEYEYAKIAAEGYDLSIETEDYRLWLIEDKPTFYITEDGMIVLIRNTYGITDVPITLPSK